MLKENEYFSNSYKSIISNKFFHLIIIFFEYVFTHAVQIVIFIRQFDSDYKDNISNIHFHLFMIKIVNQTHKYIKIILLSLIFIFILIYYYIYNKYSLKKYRLSNFITINIFEIFIFRLFFIIICHYLFSLENNIISLVFVIISILIIVIIIHSFFMNHLYYFSPHFVVYPYDYYSSFNDIFHLFQKYFICLSLQSSNINLNKYIFIIVFILQIISFLCSVYIFNFKSYYIMSNILLNKARFSFILSIVLINLIMIFLGINNIKNLSFLIFGLNIYIICFIIIQIFYNPYNYIYFNTDEHVENIYFYFYIIDHIKNQDFILEEKIEKHISACRSCDLCLKFKKYLSDNFDYKKVFKIIYKNTCAFSKIMNDIIHSVLANGKQSLKNNSYFLINIMLCYYIYYNKKEYILSSNMKIIYEIINEENTNIQESHLLTTEQIFLLNEFLNKSNKILNEIQEIIMNNNYKRKTKQFFVLYHDIFELKDKKYKTKLYYNKNEGIVNFCRHISICTMIYEELFNVTLSNGGLPLKENPVFLDEISKKQNLEFNQIIIQLDLLTFENKIIYIIGEFSKYKNKALCQLFPNIFRSKQLLIIKDKIMKRKYFKTINNENKQKEFSQFNNNNNLGQQYIDFHFIIYDNEEKAKKLRMINLRLNLIYPLNVTKKILLYGIYSIEKNVIITLDKSSEEKKEEYVLNYDDNEEQKEIKNNFLVQYKKNAKYFNNQKLTFVDKYFINPNMYNIYYIYKIEKQKTIKDDNIRNEKNKLYNHNNNNSNIKNDIYGESDGGNFNYLIQSTASTSSFGQINNDRQGFKKRNKGGKNNNKKKKNFKYYQIGIVITSIFILLFQIICHITINNYNNNLGRKNMVLSMLKNYYGIYNILFTSILSLACLAKESRGDECSSTFDLFENYYIKETGNTFLNIPEFIANQNKFVSAQLSGVKLQFMDILSSLNDESFNNLVNSEITIYSISQNISLDEIKLNLQIQNISFLDVLDFMTTGYLVMTSNYEYTKEKVYIINQVNIRKLSTSPFIHIKVNSPITQYQSFFYYLILNYQTFVKKLDIISIQLIIKTSQLGSISNSLIFYYLFFNFLFYLLLHLVLFIYIQKYFKLIADLFENIQSKLNLKNDNISVSEMFFQKIQKLKIIISLYKQDLYQSIVDLNFIYDNYKKFVEEKNKEMAKYLKKEKYINSSSITNTTKDKKNKVKIRYIMSVPENKKRLLYLLITLFYSFCLVIGLYIMWVSYFFDYKRINALIKPHANLSNDIYKLMNYYHLMIFQNLTIEDINRLERYNISNGEDVFSNMYKDIQDLYDSKKHNDKLSHFYDLDNIDSYYNYTCKTYYEYLFKSNTFLRLSNIKYKDFFYYVCEYSKIFKSNNYKQIFSIFIEYIQIGYNEINDRSYDGLITIMYKNNYPKIIVFFMTVYNYALEILGSQLQRKTNQKINMIMVIYSKISFILFYISSFIFIVIIALGYIWKLNNKYNKIHELKKVFKICNKKE